MIKGIHHVATGVPDIEAGVAFYCDALGFSVDRRSDPADLGYPHMALAAEDIEVEYDRLTAAGVTFVGPSVDFGTQKAIDGRDPFDNLIELLEEAPV